MTTTEQTKTTQAKPFDYNSLTCPLPGCGEDLHLEWNLSRPLFVGDLNDGEPPSPDDAYVSTWRVTCADGHVILVPGPALCPCDKDDCDHDDIDSSDEVRTFRAHDLERLMAVLAALSPEATR